MQNLTKRAKKYWCKKNAIDSLITIKTGNIN